MYRCFLALVAVLVLALPVRAEPPAVATDIAPVQSLVARVMDGVGGPPAVLLRPGASPHHHAMRPSDAAALSRAALVVWIGPELTPWLGEAMEALAGNARSLALLSHPVTLRLPVREGLLFAADEGEGAHDHGHGHEHGHGHGHGHGDDHEGADPHVWLDPANARAWLPVIAEMLARLDPENATTYRRNAAEGAAEIAALEAAIAEQLAPLGQSGFVVAHDALQYFETRFSLFAAGAMTGVDDLPPGAARLNALRNAILTKEIGCALTEPQTGTRLTEAVFAGRAPRLGRVDLMGAGLEPGPALYPALLQGLAESVADCLAGGD